jgi:HemY protein
VTGAVWLADHPGSVVIDWLDWRLSTSVPVLLALLLAAAGGLFLLIRLIAAILAFPRSWRANRQEKQRHQGYRALSDGLAAAAGHAKQARRMAVKAEKLLQDPSLTRILSAHTAQLTGDQEAERRHYEAMRDRPETALRGWRGLLDLALAAGNRDDALSFAQGARSLAPTDPALADILFTLLLEAGKLAEAQELLRDVGKRKAMSREQTARRRALVLNERARQAERDHEPEQAVAFAKQALSADATLADASLRLARLQLPRQAALVLEKAWKRDPLPELAAAYAALVPEEAPLQRLRRLEKLADLQPDAWTTHLIIGETALAAKLWGQARKHLTLAAEIRPTAALLGLLSRLEIEEYKNEKAAQAWLSKVPVADPDWACDACGRHAPAWSLACPQCGALDRMEWRTPLSAAANPRPAPGKE